MFQGFVSVRVCLTKSILHLTIGIQRLLCVFKTHRVGADDVSQRQCLIYRSHPAWVMNLGSLETSRCIHMDHSDRGGLHGVNN